MESKYGPHNIYVVAIKTIYILLIAPRYRMLPYRVISVEHFTQQLWNGALCFHGGVGLAQIYRHV